MVTLTLHGEKESKTFEIVSFSMREPSTMHIRFQTKAGEVLDSHGCILTYKGDIDALPSCPFGDAASCLRPAFGLAMR
jgi:hypothetical protein